MKVSMETKLAVLKRPRNEDVIISLVPYSIGRCRTANFIIAHVNVSRNHCQLVKEEGTWKVNDFSSSGTYVNGVLVGKGQSAALNNGDSIRFGPAESNLCWTFYSFGSSNVNGVDSSVKAKPEALVNSSSDNCFLKENHCSKVTCISNKLEDKLNKEQQAVLKDSEFNLTKIPNVNEVRETKGKEETESSKTIELQGVEKCSCPTKERNHEKSESKKIEELTKELQHIQSALNELEEKNNALQGKLAAEARNNSVTSLPSNLVENLTDLMENELQCTICSELFVTAVTLSCTHTFCKYCINLWKKKQKTCPICRKKITTETRSLVVDNYIDKMVENLSSELKWKRETIIKERSENGPLKKRSRVKT